MRRIWLVTTMAIGTASGCGTIINVTGIDSHGRSAYGGLARDLQNLEPGKLPKPGAAHASGGSGKAFIGFLAFYPAVLLAYEGGIATEVSLSAMGDTCTLPLLPVLRLLDRSLGPTSVAPERLAAHQADWLREADWLLLRRASTCIGESEQSMTSSTGETGQPASAEMEVGPSDTPPPLPPLPPDEAP